jgi:hypothetical protein
MKSKFAFILFFNLCCSGKIIAQTGNMYCIKVQHSFSSWGDCWNAKPTFSKALITVIGGNIVGTGSDKNKWETTENYDYGYFLFNQTLPDTIRVDAYAGNIVNDTRLEYEFTGNDLLPGVHTKGSSASDPCNNYISVSREGYWQNTRVTVDGPMELINTSINAQGDIQSTFNTEGDTLRLRAGDTYDNGTSARLEVSTDNVHWITLLSGVKPNDVATFQLS